MHSSNLKISRLRIVFSAIVFFLILNISLGANVAGSSYSYKLDDVVKFGNRSIPKGKSINIIMPAIPQKKGKIPVLRFHAYTKSKGLGGCMYNMKARFNNVAIGRKTTGGRERLITRKPMFKLLSYKGRVFPVFGGSKIMLLYSPDLKSTEKATECKSGALFDFNISDIARGVDANTLTLENIYMYKKAGTLMVDNIEIGYLDKSFLKKGKKAPPKRGQIKTLAKVGDLELYQGDAGGFAVKYHDNVELLVETALGFNNNVKSTLVADDKKSNTKVKQNEDGSFSITTVFPQLRLKRNLKIQDSVIFWEETWENTSKKDVAVPFRHRFWLRDKESKILLGGDSDSDILIASGQSPTLFIEEMDGKGAGFGITGEDNITRLSMWLQTKDGIAEIFSKSLAIPAGKKITLKMCITPVKENGYWSFINKLRRRWNINGVTMERAMFWGVVRKKGTNLRKIFKESLGHLGPVYVADIPWLRLEWDAIVVRKNRYPKLKTNEKTKGKCPDLDYKKFLTFDHREEFWKRLKHRNEVIHTVCPNVKIIQMMHASMEVVYKPLLNLFPFAEDVIISADGKPMDVGHYSQAWMKDYVQKDWGVLYFMPKPKSKYSDYLIKEAERSLDYAKADGIYCDEFSWGARGRHYSRYDYRQWDGFSVVLDDNGKIAKKMSDNSLVALEFKKRLIEAVLKRGKTFFANGAHALVEVSKYPIGRFVEGGNGEGYMRTVHLCGVPLVFGNFGDFKTKRGVFKNVKKVLGLGCLYTPVRGNLLFKSHDNFVTKSFPITVKELYSGTIIGEERIVTTKSKKIKWSGKNSTVQYYEYDQNGDLKNKNRKEQIKDGDEIIINVLKDGLTIAEIK